jgi:GMP synthase (glutamine-hydrolysing)
MNPRLLVVQNDSDKPLGRIADALAADGVALDVRMATGALPDPAGYDGLVTLPGLADPDDDDPAVHRVRHVTDQALTAGLPVLGICLGGQLLVQALGGETYRSREELGFRDVVTTEAAGSDPLLRAAPQRFSIFHAHLYAFRPPAGAVTLLENDVCVQAVRLGNTWAFQCHPEPTLAWLGGLARGIRGAPDGIDPRTVRFFATNGVDPETLERQGRDAAATADVVARGIANGFAEICRTPHRATR